MLTPLIAGIGFKAVKEKVAVRALTLCLILTLFCLLAPPVLAQPDTLWSARITTTGNPVIYDALETSNGDFILVGETNPGLPPSNFLISRLTPDGIILWTRTFGGLAADAGYSCIESSGGNLIVAGSSGSTVALLGLSATGDSLWSRTYGSGSMTAAYAMALLQDGNVAVVGSRPGADSVHADLWLLKCNTSGDTLWTRVYGGADHDIGYRIQERPDQTLLMGGYSRSSSAGDYDLWLLRVDALGNLLGSDLYGAASPDYCYALADGDSAVYLGGKTTVAGRNMGYLAKASSLGDSLWVRSFTSDGVEEQLRGVVALRSGGALCAGWSGLSWNERQFWLLAIQPDGSEAWHWVFGPSASGLYGITSLSGGGFLACGQISESNVRKGYVVRLSTSELRGRVEELETGAAVAGARVEISGTSQYTFTDADGEFRMGVVNGTYDLLVSGDCISRDTLRGIIVPPDSVFSVTIRVCRPRYEQLQTSLNVEVYNHTQATVPLQIVNSGNGLMEFGITARAVRPSGNWLTALPDTGVIPAGDTLTVQVAVTPDTTDDRPYEFYGRLLVRTNSCPGDSVVISVWVSVLGTDDNSTAIPRDFAFSVYPNPFNATATFLLAVPQTTQLTLTLYDIMGRRVAVVANERLAAGTYHIPLQAGLLPSGLYYARLESALYRATRKVLLLK